MNIGNMAKGMNDVERLAPQCEDSGNGAPAFAYMDEDPLGSFVRYTDYAEVRRLYQAEISALQQQLAAAREAETFYRGECEIYRHKVDLLMAEVSKADEENRAFLSTDAIVEIITHNTAEEWATLQRDRQP